MSKQQIKTGIELIAKERQEQIEKHGRTVESDILNCSGNLLTEAAIKLIGHHDFSGRGMQSLLGWDENIWSRMNSKPYKQRLIIAGALIAAEIDRLQALED